MNRGVCSSYFDCILHIIHSFQVTFVHSRGQNEILAQGKSEKKSLRCFDLIEARTLVLLLMGYGTVVACHLIFFFHKNKVPCAKRSCMIYYISYRLSYKLNNK